MENNQNVDLIRKMLSLVESADSKVEDMLTEDVDTTQEVEVDEQVTQAAKGGAEVLANVLSKEKGLFSTFKNEIPAGALLLVSDQPMIPEGVKTTISDTKVTIGFAEQHLKIGIDSLKQLSNNGLTVKHLRF